MHDAIIAEGLGLPAAGIMTAAFVSAAELMARVQGAEGYPFVVVPHPISSAPPATLEAWAREAVTASAAILCGTSDA